MTKFAGVVFRVNKLPIFDTARCYWLVCHPRDPRYPSHVTVKFTHLMPFVDDKIDLKSLYLKFFMFHGQHKFLNLS